MIKLQQINRGEAEVHVGKQEVRVLLAELATGAVATLHSIATHISAANNVQVSQEVLLDVLIGMLQDARNEPDVWKMTEQEN